MNNSEYLNEQIEAYLNNSLSDADKLGFETQIAQDPLLRNEVMLQQSIVEGIKQHRRLALKSRLSNIEVAPVVNNAASVSSMSVVKMVGAVALISSTLLGIYWFWPDNNNQVKQNAEATTENVDKQPSIITKNTDKNITIAPQNSPKTVITDAAQVRHAEATMPKKVSKQHTNKAAEPVRGASVQLPNISSDTDNISEFSKGESNANVPSGSIANESVKTTLKPDVLVETNDKVHTYHYKYSSNRLYLYGDFNNKPYELIELNSTKFGRKLFIFHNNAFYEIKNQQTEITPLVAIVDVDTIANLNEMRKKKVE